LLIHLSDHTVANNISMSSIPPFFGGSDRVFTQGRGLLRGSSRRGRRRVVVFVRLLGRFRLL
jgi:hypothetical protein